MAEFVGVMSRTGVFFYPYWMKQAALMFRKIALPNLDQLRQEKSFEDLLFLHNEAEWLREQGLFIRPLAKVLSRS